MCNLCPEIMDIAFKMKQIYLEEKEEADKDEKLSADGSVEENS